MVVLNQRRLYYLYGQKESTLFCTEKKGYTLANFIGCKKMAELKKKLGRPRKTIKSSARVELRLQEKEKEQWIIKAEERGYTNLSKWICSLVNAA